ncbi:MAG TPA: galactonate dehydratase [Thermomicrobiales bacterium]|jgi:galactonate dehydratase
MRITAMKRFLISDAGRPTVLVKIETEGGLYGVGEATLGAAPRAVVGLLDDLAHWVVGQDARRIEFLWQQCYRRLFFRGGPVTGSALSGIDQALWDLAGKALGVPVYQLLGGLARDRLRYYVHIGGQTAEAAAASAQRAVARGATAVRFSAVQATDATGIHDHRAAVDRTVEHTRAIREAVGPDIDLLVECHGRFDPPWASEICERVAQYRPFFVEDPIRHEYRDGLVQLRGQTRVPLAMGERAHDKWDMRELVERDLVDYLRPDVCNCGGITELRKIAAQAEVHHINLVPHNVAGPIGTAAGIHLAFAVQNVAMIEAPWAGHDGAPGLAGPNPRAEGGYILPPEGPGLGVDFDEDAAAAATFAPWILPDIRALDGSVREW